MYDDDDDDDDGNNGQHPSERVKWIKAQCRQFFRRTPADTRTVMTKKDRQFFFPGKIGSTVPGEGPHIFYEQGPA